MKHLTLLVTLILTTTLLSAQLAVTIPGDFEKNNGIVFAWSQQEEENLVITEVISLVQQKIDTVWILYQPELQMDTTTIKQFLVDHDATTEHIYYIPANYQSPLIRNYGPITGFAAFESNLERFIYNGVYSNSGANGEDSIPNQLAETWDWPIADIPLEMDGSNILHDGIKYGFSTTDLIENNLQYTEDEIRVMLKDKFNLNNWIFLSPLTNSGGGEHHSIDEFMQILDFETILVSSYPDTLPDYAVIEQNVATLESLTNAFGRPYHIIRIPASPGANGSFGINPTDEMRSYTSSILINSQIFVPNFGNEFYDSMAMDLYAESMPGYEFHGIDASYLSQQFFSLKQLTSPFPQDHYLRIEHSKKLGLQPYQPEVQITCISKSGELVEEMWLYSKINSEPEYTKTPVYLVCPEHFGVIEGLIPSDTVHYYLESISSFSTTTYPLAAPEGNFTFWMDVVSSTNDAIQEEYSTLYPNPNQGIFNIRLPNDTEKALFQIFNLNGMLLHEETVSNYQTIDLRSVVKSGSYIVRLQSDGNDELIKILIQ